MNAPRVSVIIPCYNQGIYLKEAIRSIGANEENFYEVIIINDGSTDPATTTICKELADQGYFVVEQENAGLSAARNKGISYAKGDYIFLLDADNTAYPAYTAKAVQILDANPKIAVVYGNAQFFGERSGLWKVGSFNLQRLMIANYIDACAVIRKSVLQEVGLYDVNMKLGWEDWDLWLRIAFANYEFYYIDEVLFNYRVAKSSMSNTLYNHYSKPNSIENYLHNKYPTKMGHEWMVVHYVKRFKKNPILFLGKLILKAYFPKKYEKLLQENKIRNGI